MTQKRDRLWGERFNLKGLAVALVLLIMGFAPVLSFAQDSAPETPAVPIAPKAKSSVKAVRISDVGAESERSKRVLKDILDSVQPDGTVASISLELPDLRQDVEEFQSHSKQIQARVISISELDRLSSDWDPLRDKLDQHQDRLDDRVQSVDDTISKIRQQRQLWQVTREQVEAEGVSDEVILQIDEVDQSIQEALEAANQQQAKGVRLQSNVATLIQLIERDLEQIIASRKVVVSRVFYADAAPIWDPQFWSVLGSGEMARNWVELRHEQKVIWNKFVERESLNAAVYAAITILLIFLMLLIRRKVRDRIDDEEEMAVLAAILSRPIALGFVLSFLFALAIFSNPHTWSLLALEYFLGALAVIPAVLILRRVVKPEFYPLLNIILAVYFIENVRNLFFGFPVFSRILFLLEIMTLILASWFWMRPSRWETLPEGTLHSIPFRLAQVTLRVVFSVSVMALVANVSGYAALSRMVGHALAVSIYGSMVLYGVYLVIDGLMAFGMRVWPLNSLGMVREQGPLLRHRFRIILMVAVIWIWVRGVFIRLELWPWVQGVWNSALATEVPVPQVALTLGDILTGLLVLYISLLASRFIRFVLKEDIYPRIEIRPGQSSAISTLLHYAMITIGFVFASVAMGFDANRFTLLAGAFGVGIGFGLQTIVNNFISGIILLTEQPVQVGDTIEMGEVFGQVERIGIRSSTVRSFQGSEIIVPNADLISEQVTNWTLSDRRRRIEIQVGVAYGSNSKKVIEILGEVAHGSDRLLQSPEPYALFRQFGESSLDFELRAWTDEFDNFLRVKSELCLDILAAFDEAGLEIPFPQRDLHVHTVLDEAPQIEGGERDSGRRLEKE